jgi:hypothetical protein
MKKILMTAVAVSALSAGAASAASLSASSTIGTVALTHPTATSYEPYTIASEVDAPGNAAGVLSFVPTGTIAAGTYKVTWNITGGTFGAVTSVAGVDTLAAAVTCTVSTSSTTSIVALCTPAANVASFTLTVPIATGTAKTSVVISGNLTNTSDVAVDGGAITGVTVIDYRAGLKTQATAYNATLNLTTFKKFAGTNSAGAATAIDNFEIAGGVGFASNDDPSTVPLGGAYDRVYANGAATRIATSAIQSVTSTVAGTLGVLKVVYASALTSGGTGTTNIVFTDGQSPATTGSGVATLNANNLAAVIAGTGKIGLAQVATTAVSVAESSYTVSMVPTLATGYTASTYATKTLGKLTYEGATFLAPWMGDGSNGINYTVRLANRTATPIPFVQVTLLNPYTTGTSGSVASTAPCSVGSIPASGELLIQSSTLSACFGAFKRSDVTISAGSTTGTLNANLTAKYRATSVNGTVSEVTLGAGTNTALTQ